MHCRWMTKREKIWLGLTGHLKFWLRLFFSLSLSSSKASNRVTQSVQGQGLGWASLLEAPCYLSSSGPSWNSAIKSGILSWHRPTDWERGPRKTFRSLESWQIIIHQFERIKSEWASTRQIILFIPVRFRDIFYLTFRYADWFNNTKRIPMVHYYLIGIWRNCLKVVLRSS